MYGPLLSESHWTGFGNFRTDPNLFSTLSAMRSRIISRMISEQLAIQLITSRSHVSNAKAISTSSPYQHFKERVSERQRIFDWRVITCPSCSSPQSKPVHLVLLRYRITTSIMTISKDKIEVVTSVQRRKRWSPAEKKAIV